MNLYTIYFGKTGEYELTVKANSRQEAETLCYDFMAQRNMQGDVCYISLNTAREIR